MVSMFSKSRPTTPPPPTSPIGFSTSAALAARLTELETHRRRVTEQIIQIERTGTLPVPIPERKPRERRDAALALLNEGDAAIIAVEGLTADVGEKLAALHRLCFDIDEALRFGGQHSQALAVAEYGARMNVHKGEYTKAMRRIAAAVIELERAQQERDRVIKDVLKPPRGGTPIEGAGWPLLGRLAHHGGQAYRFLQVAVAQGWLSASELQKELQDAHAK